MAKRADGRYPEGSVNEAARQALMRNIERLKAMRGGTGLASAPRPARTPVG